MQLDSIHAESQRLLRGLHFESVCLVGIGMHGIFCSSKCFLLLSLSAETRSVSFKPSAQPVYKPISSVLEKIRLRKLEILKKSVSLLFL